MRGWPAVRSTCGPSSEAKVPIDVIQNSKCKMQTLHGTNYGVYDDAPFSPLKRVRTYLHFASCILHFALPMSLQVRHRVERLVGLWMAAAGVHRLALQRSDEVVALVNQVLARAPAGRRADGVLAEQREPDR